MIRKRPTVSARVAVALLSAEASVFEARAQVAEARQEVAEARAQVDASTADLKAITEEALAEGAKVARLSESLAQARGETILWRSVVLDLLKGYDISDIGEYLERAGLPGCQECGGPLDLGAVTLTTCHHCMDADAFEQAYRAATGGATGADAVQLGPVAEWRGVYPITVWVDEPQDTAEEITQQHERANPAPSGCPSDTRCCAVVCAQAEENAA